jgi:hypothetical protein
LSKKYGGGLKKKLKRYIIRYRSRRKIGFVFEFTAVRKAGKTPARKYKRRKKAEK